MANYFIYGKEKIAIVYHLGQHHPRWKLMYQDQIEKIIITGLYDVAEFIHIGIAGKENLKEILPKFRCKYNENCSGEVDTLEDLYQFCKKNAGYKVLYLHTKGLSHASSDYELEYRAEGWRKYLEYFTIHNWKENLKLLNNYDCVGTEYIKTAYMNFVPMNFPHYSGGFWWANSNHIKKIGNSFLHNPSPPYIDPRYNCEFWLFSQETNHYNHFNLQDTFGNFYYEKNYTFLEYVKTHTNQL